MLLALQPYALDPEQVCKALVGGGDGGGQGQGQGQGGDLGDLGHFLAAASPRDA